MHIYAACRGTHTNCSSRLRRDLQASLEWRKSAESRRVPAVSGSRPSDPIRSLSVVYKPVHYVRHPVVHPFTLTGWSCRYRNISSCNFDPKSKRIKDSLKNSCANEAQADHSSDLPQNNAFILHKFNCITFQVLFNLPIRASCKKYSPRKSIMECDINSNGCKSRASDDARE